MTKSIYRGLLLLTISATTFTSCKKDFLELNPPTSLTPDQALGTEQDIQVALRGAYAGLRTGAGGFAADYFGRTVPVLGDIMADNAYQHSVNTNRYTLFNNYTANAADGNATGLWRSAYQAILRANNIINSGLAANDNINQYKGEAYAIRALSYFTLVRYFARPYTDNPEGLGVPVVTTYDANLKPARNTISEVYTLILSDLNNAFTLMTKYTNSSQFSKYAAKALEAKVYLTMGDYAKAKTSALDVINNGGFTALTAASHAGYWANAGISTSKQETIFEVSFDAVGNVGFDGLSYIYSQNGNYGDLVVSDDLYALFGETDVRRNLYPVVARPASSSIKIPTVDKYPVFTGDVNNTKVLRLSEMYLIVAEASAATNEDEARQYLNMVTSNRGAAEITSTGAQLFEDIITERRKEFAFEGDRYMDLMRLKRPVVRSTNYPIDARNVPYSNFRRILPIPQSEIDANENIRSQQNPEY